MPGAALPTTVAELVELAEKYETLGAMRRAQERGEAPPERSVIHALAARFPGALHELDTLPLDAIDERAAALRGASTRAAGPTPPWMTWMARYHALVRQELAARRTRARPAPKRERATAIAIAAIADEAGTSPGEVEAALFARRRRGVSR